jgi:uncharacterized protein YdhG (YjbR/CyaY superfamily)
VSGVDRSREESSSLEQFLNPPPEHGGRLSLSRFPLINDRFAGCADLFGQARLRQPELASDPQKSTIHGIPTYKLNGRPVIYFAGLRQHYSIYPANARLVAAFKRELAPYEFNGKGTIRFPLDKPVPTTLIEHIATFLVKEVAGAVKTKTAKHKTASRQ